MATYPPKGKRRNPTRLLNQYELPASAGPATPEQRAEGWYKKPSLGRADKDQPDNMQSAAGMSLGNIHGGKMLAVRNIRTRQG